ncbi:MAG: GGDEF domain-containing protein [Lachnospiraceae bacterium]|nr:GGDEF domain-containing protein [Lachnospiraceae bacterium]
MDEMTGIDGCERRLARLLFADAYYTYSFDVTTGRILNEIVGSNGYNYTQAVTSESQCSFDEMVQRVLYKADSNVEFTIDSGMQELSCKALLRAFEKGKRRVEIKLHSKQPHAYHRLTYFLDADEETGHVMAYVLCQDITDTEKQWIRENSCARRELEDTESILSCAGVGTWHIQLLDNEKPVMTANGKMMELLGMSEEDLSGEELYERWYAGIKQSSLASVKESVGEMLAGEMSENTYVWVHPILGERYVRCGGTAQYVEGKGYILRGYHSDVTAMINSDMKHKQQLTDALEETKKQKMLLQQALDNYKQADYDRRRDFLTGLRNRQDMYELLQDNLLEKRDQITAMFMMDIDNFKMLNDHFGHVRGDECLRKIGEALKAYAKANDMYFYRYGGEEMLGISFGGTKTPDEIAQELVALIYDLQLQRNDVETGVVTVSLGYTSDNSHYEKMIDKADNAMYCAKSNGKNMAVCFEKMA